MKKRVNQGLAPMEFWAKQIARTKKRRRNCNRGFSLVELIIVIAIMAVLAAAIAPALIRYINKARKADDIAAADTIGATFQSALADDEKVYQWFSWCASDIRLISYTAVRAEANDIVCEK